MDVPPPSSYATRHLTTFDWIVTLVIAAIPVLNIVFWVVWAIGRETPIEKRNYARASLIVAAVLSVLIGFSAVFGLVLYILFAQGNLVSL